MVTGTSGISGLTGGNDLNDERDRLVDRSEQLLTAGEAEVTLSLVEGRLAELEAQGSAVMAATIKNVARLHEISVLRRVRDKLVGIAIEE